MNPEPWHLAEGVSAITPDRLKNLVHAVERTRGIPGEMAEVGVFRGGSAKVIATVRPEVTLHLFDTFEGLPFSEEKDLDPEGYVTKGRFACSLEEVLAYLDGYAVVAHPGVFPGTLELAYWPGGTSFVHVDCDLGATAWCAIEAFWPCMPKGGIMYFDDYGCLFTGVTRAVDAAFAPEQIEKQYDMYGNQIGALVVKR